MDTLFSDVLMASPLPANPVARESMVSPNGPLGCCGVGPSADTVRPMLSRRSSHSTGTWVRSIGMTVLSVSTGPPLYGGSS